MNLDQKIEELAESYADRIQHTLESADARARSFKAGILAGIALRDEELTASNPEGCGEHCVASLCNSLNFEKYVDAINAKNKEIGLLKSRVPHDWIYHRNAVMVSCKHCGLIKGSGKKEDWSPYCDPKDI